jgi:hypothetical protein
MRFKKRSKKKRFADIKAWLPHNLQLLPINRFAQVVNRVLRGEDEVVNLVPESEFEQWCAQSNDKNGRKNKR